MNISKEIDKKEKELKQIKSIIEENLIVSQLKYIEYISKQEEIENEIKTLRERTKEPRKEWIILEGGWRKRVYKNE